MKKAFKSALSLLLCMIMVVSAFPISTFAEECTDVDSDLAYSTGNAMGKIVNNLALQESERKSDDYCIADTVFNGSTASVKYSAIADCKLIVAIFDEKSGKMIGSGNVDVTADNNEATVTVDCAVPSHYEVRSYLVDSDLSALSTEYRDIYHTSAFEEFSEATPEDYKGDEVIIFDEEESDFGVLDNNVISAETSEAMSFDYNEATLTYTFKNATDEVKGLSVGEVFYYEYGESPDEFLLFKVRGISVDGSTVKIVEDENISLSDAFKFIRIDEDADFSQVDIDESELGECLSEISSPQKAPAKQSIKDGQKTFSRGLKIAYTLGSDGPAKASIDGQMNVEISISTKLYYAPKLFGRDYCEFKTQTDFKTSYKITVSGKIGLDKTKCRIPIPSIPIGPFLLTLSIYPIADFTGSITLGADVNESYTYTFDSETQKMNKVKKTEMLPNVEINEKIEFRLGVGVELKLSLATVLGFAVSGEGGAKGTVTAVTGLGLWLDKHHSCAVCFDGTAKKFVDIKLSFSIKIVPQILEFEFTALKWSAEEYLLDFYVSVSDSGLKYGLGKCPNIEYSVEITVLDKNSLPINEADVTCSTGKCDADGDGKFDDDSAQTDESGKVTFYLKQGSHSVTVRDAADEKTVDISIIANAKSVTVTLDNSTGGGAAPTPGIIDKLRYTLDNGEAIITGCSESISGDIILPSTIYGAPVTKIERCAFRGRKGITSVILPSTINIIDHYAFENCSSLTSVNIPDSVTSIGSGAFYGCSSLTSVNIPDSVTSIGYDAFNNTKIYNSASNWENGVLYINNALIKAERSLSGSYSIRKGTKVIATSAFAKCTDLTRVTIPDSVISIGGSAFYGCSSLSAILIPAGVNNIGSDAFTNCTVLNAINVVTANQVYSSIDGVLFNKSKTELIAYPAGKGTIYSIPSGTTSIGYDAFNYCKGLTDVTIPDSVTSIGNYAFESCSSLTSVNIPNSVTSIGYRAFVDCSSLTSVTIPDGVTSIDSSTFSGCSSLASITIPDSVTSIGSYAFEDCSSLASITIPDSVTSIGSYAFEDCSSLKDVYYSGTQEQWKKISIGSYNGYLTKATIHYGSSAPAANAGAMRAPAAPAAQSAVYTATAQNAVPGELYMLYAFSSGTDLSSLEYVAQLRADSGEVKFRYIPRNLGDLNVVIVGKFGDSSVQEPVEPEYGVERLELISPPAKVEYDYLSSPVVRLKGLRLKAVYSDGTEKEITDIKSITASKVDTSKLGDQEITLTYEGVSIKIAVTVVPRKFKLVWIVDGSQTELTAAEGSKITKPATPELEGYDFMGWSPEVPETMPAQDMTFTAVFEPIKTKISINTPSVTTVSYGFTLNLHANVTDLPEGARVVWSMDGSGFELIPSADGMTCGVKSVSKGSATITAKVVDKNGNAVKDANGNEITASQQLTSKAGFFQKLAAFFKKLFGSNMVIPYALEWIIK